MTWAQVIKTIALYEHRLTIVRDPERRTEINAKLAKLRMVQAYRSDSAKWKQEHHYGQRWKAEGRYSIFKRVLGEGVFSKEIELQEKEVILKVSLMNLFTSLTIGAFNFNQKGVNMIQN